MHFDIPDSIDTPSLVVDLDIVERNLAEMQRVADAAGAELVPHFKTHRSLEFAALQARYGAAAFCVAKLGEAEFLADQGFTRFVMAYPLVGEGKIRRALALACRAEIVVSVEDLATAHTMGEEAVRVGQSLDVMVIVDTGYHREGLQSGAAVELAMAVAATPGLRFRGILTHEGHASAARDEADLSATSRDAGEEMVKVAETLRDAGLACDIVSVGSTASARHIASVVGVTQVRPGIYPFNDYGQILRGTVSLEGCAAVVVATVVSHSRDDSALIDAGSKSLGQDLLGIWSDDAPAGHGLVIDHPGWELSRLSEEHGWLSWAGEGTPTPMPVGTRLAVLPNHICTAFHVLGQAEVVRAGHHIGTWVSEARGESR